MLTPLEDLFPGLQSSPYVVTSPATKDYNCVAWAVGDVSRWWWPDPDPDNDAVYWPADVDREEKLSAFAAALATLGYQPSGTADLEAGVEKVALFARPDGSPTHAARQLPDGRWTSKLGALSDIEHDLAAIAGVEYGAVARIFARPRAV
jgi:hypothetical protein